MNIDQLYQSTQAAISMAKQAEALARQAVQGNANAQQLLGYAQALKQESEQMRSLIARMQVSGQCGDPKIQRIENIPGRRVPFDMLVDIHIPANQQGTVQGSFTISQEGPFVAVARMATFVSALQYSVADNNSNALSFNGRSFGRYRPIHSAWDLNDGKPHVDVYMAAVAPGTGSPSITSPSNTSSFRSMEGDFRVMCRNAGSSFPRSNIEVPSTFWTKSINEPWELGALDFMERGEVYTFEILPMHPNNPTFGNINGFSSLNANWPWLGSQFDAVEGINDASRADYTGTVDPVTRNPAGILTIGFHGYRIVQAPGVGPF
jgi:hypothetical protein